VSEDMASEDVAGPDILNRSVDELKLSMASMAALRGCQIQTVAELVQRAEGELLQNGIASLEIKDVLADAGLSLGMTFDQNGIVITPGTAQLTITPGTAHVTISGVFSTRQGEPPKCAAYLLYLFLPSSPCLNRSFSGGCFPMRASTVIPRPAWDGS
jgi:hypothetical protein